VYEIKPIKRHQNAAFLCSAKSSLLIGNGDAFITSLISYVRKHFLALPFVFSVSNKTLL